MAREIYPMVVLGLIVATSLTAGCSSTSKQQAEAQQQDMMRWQLGPLVDEQGDQRSLALNSPQMDRLVQAQSWEASQAAWYYSRVDHGPAVTAGHRLPSYEITQVKTRDRISGTDGDVKDNYSRNVTRERFTETVR